MRRHLALYLVPLSFVVTVTTRAWANEETFTTIDFPGAIETTAHGINPAGAIVGFYANADQPEHHISFLLSGGTFTAFEFPSLSSPEPSISTNAARSWGDTVMRLAWSMVSC